MRSTQYFPIQRTQPVLNPPPVQLHLLPDSVDGHRQIRSETTNVDIDLAIESRISLYPKTHAHRHRFSAGPIQTHAGVRGF
jgi:hypothetical protein